LLTTAKKNNFKEYTGCINRLEKNYPLPPLLQYRSRYIVEKRRIGLTFKKNHDKWIEKIIQ
jgi:hypothetical protein